MAVNILGKYIPSKWPVSVGLFKTFRGLGLKGAEEVCAKVGLYPKMKVSELNEIQIINVSKELNNLVIENEYKNMVRDNIDFLKKLGNYRGIRHSIGLPVNGQNTRNNARTARILSRTGYKRETNVSKK